MADGIDENERRLALQEAARAGLATEGALGDEVVVARHHIKRLAERLRTDFSRDERPAFATDFNAASD